MTLEGLIKRALARNEVSLKVTRPMWPSRAYLEIRFSSNGVVEPTGSAILTDESGRVVANEMVMMLYAPIESDYTEWSG